jgi:flagellar protein FlaF
MRDAASQAYGKSNKLGLSGRTLEARVFTQAAQQLQDAITSSQHNARDSRDKVLEALRYNNRLWTIVQAAVSDPASPLPQEVRANLMSLSLFVDQRTREAIADPAPDLLDALIDINRNIAMAQYNFK